jgi:hypothetical protein
MSCPTWIFPAMKSLARRGISWRHVNRVLHRDMGYLAVGTTLVYVLSGILLNHVHGWNSNYRVERASETIEPLQCP